MFLRSQNLDFEPRRVHTVTRTLGKDTVTNKEIVTMLELQTETNHITVTDRAEIEQCFKEVDILTHSEKGFS